MLSATENFARFRIIADTAKTAKSNRNDPAEPEKADVITPTDLAKNLKP